MRLNFALVSLAALSLALSGCDKQSGHSAQGADNAVSGNAATADEVTSDEAPSTSAATPEAGASFKHVVDRSHKGAAMPADSFMNPEGKPTSLAKEAAGKPLIINLWATWCAPCVAELPALDRFAGQAASKGVKVIAVSQDQGGAAQIEPFLAKRNLVNLKPHLDPETVLGFAYGASLPTTILYDKDGKEVARVVGGMDWTGAEGQALLAEIVG